MATKKIITFFSLFFLTVFSLIYISARKENRKDYRFVITKVIESAKGYIAVSNSDNEFGFSSFDSYKIDIEKGDSLVKKTFSKNVYIYRKDKKTDKYRLFLTLNESGTFPIDWQ
ncbi:MAG: hypothetical protein ABI576_18010 [Flavobacterium sp.]